MAEDSGITLDRLLKLRRATSAVAGALESELNAHLDTLAPLLRPKLLLGDFIAGESSESRPQAEAAYKELCELFARVAQRPFRLSPNLPRPIPAIRVRLELHPLEEEVTVGSKKLTVVSPFSWVLSYPGACGLSELRRMLAGQESRTEDEIRNFVLNSCILKAQVERAPKVVRLLNALRFDLEITQLGGLGELPVPVIHSVIRSMRPAPQVMADAAEMAGLSTFGEVIDREVARSLEDPLNARLAAALAEQGL